MAAIATLLRPEVPLDEQSRANAAHKFRGQAADLIALGALVAVTLGIQSHLLAAETLISLDSASQFFPWYAFLGESLRAGHIPGWNPATFSGTPFAANPLSGWTYVPAMLLFSVLPFAPAAKAYLLLHPLLAASSSFALARALGLSRLGAFTAGLAYSNSGFLQIQNSCCFAFASVYAWLPLAVFGSERAIRATCRTLRAAWWGLAALALSQIIAAWLGQGTYYASMIIGGYIAYRTLFTVPASTPISPYARIGRFVQHEIAIFALGAAFAAAGLLPRLEFISLSNLDGGYSGVDGRVGGLHPEQWVFVVTPGMWYVGASVLVLALLAPILVRRRVGPAVWFFAASSLIALILSDTFETPLDRVLFHLLPGFEHLHPHAPERILTVAYLGPGLLAGATISAFTERIRCKWGVSRFVRASSGAVAGALILTVVALDLAVAGAKARADRSPRDLLDGIATLAPVDLERYYQPGGAASFLQQELATAPSRFLGYAPDVDGRLLAYTVRSFEPSTADLLVNNRSVALRLQDVQGYDASHLRRYDDYLAVLNGKTQNYHDADVFSEGLSSPLLDLLNARYLVVPPADRVDPADASTVLQSYSEVYADQHVRVLENPLALSRAWIVHAATQLRTGATSAAALIASGAVDPRQTAVLEDAPPPLEISTHPPVDQARVTHYEADQILVSTSTTATGLLVVSEVYYPAWKAYVDGQPTRLYVADGVLRAVQLPPGEHTVELRFESGTLAIGVVISSIAVLLLVLVELAALIGNVQSLANFIDKPASVLALAGRDAAAGFAVRHTLG